MYPLHPVKADLIPVVAANGCESTPDQGAQVFSLCQVPTEPLGASHLASLREVARETLLPYGRKGFAACDLDPAFDFDGDGDPGNDFDEACAGFP